MVHQTFEGWLQPNDYDSTTIMTRAATSRGELASTHRDVSRVYVPDLPPDFSHRANSPMTIARSADLHMS